MNDTDEGTEEVTPMAKNFIPKQLTKADIDRLYTLTSLLAPYTHA